jgi:hypothetical protein
MPKKKLKGTDVATDPETVLSNPKRAVPSAAHGTGPWGVNNAPLGSVAVNPRGGGSFTAPMGGTPEEEAERFRMYGLLQMRAQYPEQLALYEQLCKEEAVEADIVEAVLMGAVNAFTQKRGVSLEALRQPKLESEYGAEYIAKQWVKRTLAPTLSSVSSLKGLSSGTGKGSTIPYHALCSLREAIDVGRDAADRDLGMAYKRLAAAAKSLQEAFDLERSVEAAAEKPTLGAEAGGDLSPEERSALARGIIKQSRDATTNMSTSDRKTTIEALTSAKDMAEADRALQELAGTSHSLAAWGKMFESRARPMTRRAVRHSFRHRPTFVGAFRYPHRALIPAMDGRAWHARLPGLGGTVLLDKSGSMYISETQLQQLLHLSPLATIAVYSGTNRRLIKGCCTGDLVILAKEGRYAAKSVWPAIGAMNVVDGPALRWLMRMPRPRAWICDLGVTGYSIAVPDTETNSSRLLLECLLICKMGGIRRFASIYEYLKSHQHRAQFR